MYVLLTNFNNKLKIRVCNNNVFHFSQFHWKPENAYVNDRMTIENGDLVNTQDYIKWYDEQGRNIFINTGEGNLNVKYIGDKVIHNILNDDYVLLINRSKYITAKLLKKLTGYIKNDEFGYLSFEYIINKDLLPILIDIEHLNNINYKDSDNQSVDYIYKTKNGDDIYESNYKRFMSK